MGEIRRFTKEDWYGWAGAEKFENGSEPFIYERTMNDGFVEITIIADRGGICFNIISNDGDNMTTDTWEKDLSLSALRAAGELNHLVGYVDKFDSAPDIAYALDHNSEGFEDFEYYGEV